MVRAGFIQVVGMFTQRITRRMDNSMSQILRNVDWIEILYPE